MAASNTIRYMIAAEAATEILSQKLEMLLSHPVRTRCLLMEPLAQEAKKKLATIQEFFSTQDRLSQSTVWLRRLLQAIYDAEEFIDKFHLREARGRHEILHVATRPPTALISKYKLWRDLSNLVNKMEELCQDQGLTGQKEAKAKTRNDPGGSSSPASVPGQGEKLARLTSLWDQQASENFFRQEEKKILMERFVEGGSWGNLAGTLIWGEQGAGKTFLARWVCREAMCLGFEWRAWVRLSASMDMQELLFEILKQLGELTREPKDMSLDELQELLYKRLATGTKFLIVLDDVQSSNVELLQILVGIRLYQGRGHIITTTQDEGVAKSMSFPEAGPIKLSILDPEKSREMLATRLYRVADSQRLSYEEKHILNRCRGLPLCISLLGGFLLNVGEQERAALAKEGSMMTLLDILQLSVHKLPVHLKPCFIYMALFPIAFPIPTRRLVRLWLAEGLLDSHCYNGERETTRTPEAVGEAFILELADRNVIDVVSWRADGFPKACQMLTSLYDMICPIAMGTGFLHVHAAIRNPTGQQQQLLERTNVRWLAEHTNIVTDSHYGSFLDLHLGHVRSFLSFYMRRGILTKDISTFLRIMTSKAAYSLLRVLDLEGVYRPSLQGVLHKLVLLRYLGLRCTMLDSLPREVVDLCYLETLDIKHTNITSLPSSLWKARNLRHLHLNWFYINLNTILKACSNNVMALTKLRTLSGLVISEVKLNLMSDPVDSLTTLTTLKLFLRRSGGDTSGAAEKEVADWISFRLANLQSLTFGVTQKAKSTKKVRPKKEAERAIRMTSQIGLLPKLSLAEKHHDLLELYLLGQLDKPIWTQLLPGSLRVLTLSGSKVEADMMPQLADLLKNLRTLRLLANSFLGTRLRFAKDGFPSLMILKIWRLPCLVEVIIEPGAMLHLKELELRHLDAIKNVKGIGECKELKNISGVVKKGAQAFVDHLKTVTGETRIAFAETDDDDDDDEDEDDSWDCDEE
ncbi:disease resistance protein RPM1-like [Syzygium oleosum]|uniref:disease resistance protein RPM1-like n=1 Tax=Syzygium oleosum TaxID=219896 RepID=UPI0024BABA55|nr:disease resistance protein RPM1-like [Syzygium oleosum]